MLHAPIDAEAGAAMNGGRRPTIVAAPASASPELSGRPRRRTFTAKDKLRILADIDRPARARGLTAAACAALGVSRASVRRRRARLTAPPAIVRPRPRPTRALSVPQRQTVLDLLHAPRFADQAPAEIYASLLGETWRV